MSAAYLGLHEIQSPEGLLVPLEASPRLLDHRVPRRRVPGGAPLSRLFDPESVALIGASERPGALGTVVMKNLLEAGFEGRIHAVNPKHTEIQGQPCTARVTDIGAPVDLAIIATPARAVPTVLAECGAAGIRAALERRFGGKVEIDTAVDAALIGGAVISAGDVSAVRPGIQRCATSSASTGSAISSSATTFRWSATWPTRSA